jgi:hypothetical protein
MATNPEPFTTYAEGAEPDSRMSDDELVSHLSGHEQNALGYYEDQIAEDQSRAIDYYYRRMPDLPAPEGTSSVVDGTVGIVIDNALASILKPFVSSDETVSFAPRSEEDVEIASQATEYINYVFNVDNPGFCILHNWFKDALLTKIGIVKCWWEETVSVDRDTVIVSNEIALAELRMSPDYAGEEIQPDGTIAVMLERQNVDGRAKVENVPPEEFFINPFARSLKDASYIAHSPRNITRSDLLEMGFDAEVVASLTATTNKYFGSYSEGDRRQARYQDEQYGAIDQRLGTPHSSQELIELRDEYVRIDYDGDGFAELRRIVRSGEVILLNEEIEQLPFAVLCPVPMPHKVIGLSLADQVMDLQRIATVIWRQTLDNLYKTNNPRPIVGEGAERADGSTADSLEDNTAGAAVLVRDASQFQLANSVPFFARESFGMLEYVEGQQEARTGIGRTGQGMDPNALKGSMTATEASIINQGRNSRAEMIARIFAETGVKDLFKLLLGIVTKYQPQERIVRLRNKWVPVDPSGWPEMDVAISVGLGLGDKMERMAAASSILEDYAALAQSPYASMVGPEQVYNALKMKYNAADIKNIDDFLIEPNEENQQQPQETPPDPALIKVQAEAEMKMQAQQFEQSMKAQSQEFEQNLAEQRAIFEAQLAIDKAAAEAELARWKATQEAARKVDLPDNRPGGSLSE